jgi:hypothetical protein
VHAQLVEAVGAADRLLAVVAIRFGPQRRLDGVGDFGDGPGGENLRR